MSRAYAKNSQGGQGVCTAKAPRWAYATPALDYPRGGGVMWYTWEGTDEEAGRCWWRRRRLRQDARRRVGDFG